MAPTLKVRARQKGAPRFPFDPERQRPGPPRGFHVSELPPEEQTRYQPERPTKADLEAAAAAGLTVEDVAEQYQRPVSRVVGLCKHHRLGLPMRPKPAKREEADDKMQRFTAEDFLRVLREDPDMPIEALAARLELTDANLYYHARRHGGVAALRERARAMAGAVPVAAPPAPVAQPNPAPPVDEPRPVVDDTPPQVDVGATSTPAAAPDPDSEVDDQAGSVDYTGSAVDATPPQVDQRTWADLPVLPGSAPAAVSGAPALPDPGEAPEPDPTAADPAATFTVPDWRHAHSIQGQIPLGELRSWVDELEVLVGQEAPVDVELRGDAGWRVTPAGVWNRLLARRQPRRREWAEVHTAEGRMPLAQLAALLTGLALLLGDGAPVEARLEVIREAAS